HRLKVLDFGIARECGSEDFETQRGLVIGTAEYMSPEQVRGDAFIDARTDVYSLGCVLFECITARCAFAAASTISVLTKVLLDKAPRLGDFCENVPPGL